MRLPLIDYFVAGGGVLFIGAAVTVLIKRSRKRRLDAGHRASVRFRGDPESPGKS